MSFTYDVKGAENIMVSVINTRSENKIQFRKINSLYVIIIPNTWQMPTEFGNIAIHLNCDWNLWIVNHIQEDQSSIEMF